MRANNLVLRCYAEKKESYWQAFCIDLSLAVQGDSFDEVKAKLDSMVVDYIEEALGEDRQHAAYLLTRKSPLRYRLKFEVIRFLNRTIKTMRENFKTFKEVMPLQIQGNDHKHA